MSAARSAATPSTPQEPRRDPAQGFTYHGPFATSDEACEYGDLHRGNDADEYWVTPLQQLPPN